MHHNPPDDSALSPVIGEMMMIALAVLLVSIFSVTLLGLLPAERSDSIDIIRSYNSSSDTLQLWHKGGDWVKKSDLKVVIIRDDHTTETISLSDDNLEGDSFDLGDNITITKNLVSGDIVRLISDKNVIYSGII
ncbi:type IV pilin [Methanolacinia paynteri]|uniref:type IV pilin n=1 Tax=Methanolacinia paynteri TaxID=230356 RepID=UPI000A01E567|nr:type IV pilin N-terminal domain-containing protein [Methanolacinia paynteri]